MPTDDRVLPRRGLHDSRVSRRVRLLHHGADSLLRRQADGQQCHAAVRCAGCCKPVGAAWLATGPTLNERVRPRRAPSRALSTALQRRDDVSIVGNRIGANRRG